jgi:O-antigen/teichoic acid export membrane protein
MAFILNSITIKYMLNIDYIKRTLLLALPNIIIAILSVIFLLNMNSHKYLGRIIPYVIVTSIVGSYYLIRSFIKGKTFINIKYWKYAMMLSIPLIFHGLSVNVLSVSDRTMITAFRTASETGIYSLVYNLSMIPLVVSSSIESIWIPWFNKKLQNNEKDIINKNVKVYIEILITVIIGVLLVGPEILTIMAPKEYWVGKILLPPILLASFFIFLYSISVDLEYYYKSTKIIAFNTIIAACINLGLNFIFIPKFGANAAAYTTVVAYAVSFGIHYKAARKIDSDLFPLKIYVKPIGIMSIAIAVSYIIMDYTIIRWLIALVGAGLYGLISYKKHRFSALFK